MKHGHQREVFCIGVYLWVGDIIVHDARSCRGTHHRYHGHLGERYIWVNVNALTVNKSGMGFKIQITITRKLNVNIDHVSKQDLNRLRQKF